jgi:predicted secreted protein
MKAVTALIAVALMSGCALTSPPKAATQLRTQMKEQTLRDLDDLEKDVHGILINLATIDLQRQNDEALRRMNETAPLARTSAQGAYLMQQYQATLDANRAATAAAIERLTPVYERIALVRARVEAISAMADGEVASSTKATNEAVRLAARAALDEALRQVERRYVTPMQPPPNETRY